MILLDYNQVAISNFMGQHANFGEVNEELLRHMILNSIRLHKKKFESDYGELIIACDDRNYWRKKVFPYYKSNRKKVREQSSIDWNVLFTSLNKVRDELKEYFPYRVIQVDTAEADDVIGTLCHEFGRPLGGDPILILSGDKDFMQLQKFSNVKQYDPIRKRWLTTTDANTFLLEHIIKGDTGDGVPNILSSDDTFVSGSRQKPVRAKFVDQVLHDGTDILDNESLRNYYRNKKMIDLAEVPVELSGAIMSVYNSESGKGRSKLFNYFIKNKLKNLTENISEF